LTNPQRLEFVTRHFRDLQTIRFAPVPTAMLLAPFVAHRVAHVSPSIAWVFLLSFLLCVVGFYRWSTLAIRRRYGAVNLSREEALRMLGHPIIFALNIIMVAALTGFYFADHTHFWDVYIPFTI
jgi:hypothetical protein